METIHIQVGDVQTLEVENWQITPDDRQQQVEIVGGVAVAVKCAVRCDTGYYIEDNTTISFVGTNTAKWKVAEDNNYADAAAALANATWLDTIALANVADTNTIFWVKAMSSADENPQNDTSVDVQAEGLVVASF